jgi:hypothetical protein
VGEKVKGRQMMNPAALDPFGFCLSAFGFRLSAIAFAFCL